MSLATRVALGVVALILLTALGMMALLSSHQRDSFVTDRQTLLAAISRSDETRLRHEIDDLRKDVLFLSRTPPVQKIIQSAPQKGGDLRDGNSLATWKNRLEDIFSAFVEGHREYVQIRYIGVADQGREVVRVTRKDERVVVTPRTDLQQKADRDYFQATLKLKAGEVYLSEINLNQEHGKIQIPHVAVLRAATPVFGPDGAIAGVIVINLDFDYLVQSLAPALPGETAIHLANSSGDYLMHPEAGRSFGFDLGQRHRWQDELPSLQVPSAGMPSPAGSPPSLQRLPSARGMVYAMAQPVFFDSLRPERHLVLLYSFPETAVETHLARVREPILVGVAISSLLILVLLLWLVRRTFAPLHRLTLAAQAIAAGRYDLPLPEGGAGELGTLVQSFRGMQESIALHDAQDRTIVDTSIDGFWMTDKEGRILDVNEAYVRRSGYTREELLTMRVAELKANEDPDKVRNNMLEAKRIGTYRFESEHHCKDGTVWPVEATVTYWPIGEGRFFAFLRDVSDRRAAERERSKGVSLMRSVIDSLRTSIAVLDRQGLIVSVNAAWCDFAAANAGTETLHSGVGLDYFATCRAAAASDPIAAKALAGLEAVRDGRLDTFTLEYPCHSPTVQRWFILLARPLGRSEEGMVVSHFDITERKQQEEKIHRLLTENETILNNALVGIVYLRQRQVVSCNRRFEEIFQYGPGELIGASSELFYDSRDTYDRLGMTAYPATAQADGFNEEVRLRHKDGSVFWGLLGGRAIDPAHPLDGSIWVCTDITSRKHTERMIQRDREQQELLRRILEIILKGESVEASLTGVLRILLSVSWLSLLPRGGVFRMEEDGSGLHLIVAHNLPPEVLRQCAHVALGHCHCGKAAATGAVQYAAHVDGGTGVVYADMTNHAHYCVPIVSGKRNLGVLTLYLPADKPRDPYNEEFLAAVAGILASYLLRTEAEQALVAQQQSLEAAVKARTTELQTSEARARALLATMLDGVAHIDASGIVLSVNTAILDMFGYQEEELVGRNVSILMPEPHASAHDGYLSRYAQTRQAHVVGQRREVEGRRKDGGIFSIELAVNEMVDDLGSTYIGVIRDMTAQKAAEHELQAALQTARDATQAKGRFLANMSHEIRTPLNAVLGFAQIGMRDGAGSPAGKTFSRIADAGEHLLGVINDILDISKIEVGKLQIEQRPFALHATVDGVVSFVVSRAEAKGLRLIVSLAPDLPSWVQGDGLRLAQILTNLLSNAIKFTASGEVRLRVARDGDNTYFRITDTGIGMNTEQLERLFHPFEQADSSTTRIYGGTGLGLAISLDLARLMGGDINVDSRPDVGSAFMLSLPLPKAEPPQHAAAEPSSAAGPRLSGVSVLAADDVEMNRLILEDLLSREGARVVFAGNGQEALDQLERGGVTAFDVVLMDVQMPVMDGFEATRRIHALAPALPVIGVTAHALAEEREKCLAVGMVDVVTKPINMAILVEAIRRQVQGRMQRPAAGEPQAIAASPAPALCVPSGTSEAPTSGKSAIDWPALLARFNGRREFVGKIAASVREHHADTPAKLRAAAQQQDRNALAFIAHSLKGVSGNLEAGRLSELARTVEASARTGETIGAEQIDALANALEAVLAELEHPDQHRGEN